MPGIPLFFLLDFLCTSHASVLAFCFFLPHVQRREHHSKFGGVERRIASRQKRRLQQSLAFLFCSVFVTIMLFPASLGCFWVMFIHAKICCFCSPFSLYKSSIPLPLTTSYLSCLAYLRACSGGDGGGEGEMGHTKDVRRNSSARNETNDKYNMMLLWSDRDH